MSTGRTVVQQSVMLPEQIVVGILSKMTRLSINIGTNDTSSKAGKQIKYFKMFL